MSKIINTFIDNAENLDIAISMYDLLQYMDNYSMTSRSLWNCRDKKNDSAIENNNKTITSKSFEYKAKIIMRTPDDNNTLKNAEVVVPLKYLSIFGDFLIYL